MTINLIVQYYKCDNKARQEEIDTCLSNNLSNKFISSVHLLTEQFLDTSQFPNNEKIMQIVIGERLTFEVAFQHANQQPKNQIWILSNADIYFDGSLIHLNDAKLDEVVFALTRHDIQKDGTLKIVDPAFSHGCQDAWIFKTPIDLDELFTKFCLGIPGCDNRIAYEFVNAGYIVLNPAEKIIIRHLDLVSAKDIFQKDEEYAALMSEKNILDGKVVPPPFQYYLYPINKVKLSDYDLFKLYLNKIERLYIELKKTEQQYLIAKELMEKNEWVGKKLIRSVLRRWWSTD